MSFQYNRLECTKESHASKKRENDKEDSDDDYDVDDGDDDGVGRGGVDRNKRKLRVVVEVKSRVRTPGWINGKHSRSLSLPLLVQEAVS